MRALLLVMLLVSPALAREHAEMTVGLGTTVVRDPGWDLRMESVIRSTDEPGAFMGGRVGLELWGTPAASGFAMPIGYHVGVRDGLASTMLGAGVGLFALGKVGADFGLGVAPFVNTTVSLAIEERTSVSLDLRATREVLGDAPDVTRYSVMVMFGRRLDN